MPHQAVEPSGDWLHVETEVRWAVEGPADYAFVAAVYDALYPNNRAFTSADVRALLAQRPDLATFGGARRL